MNSICSMNFFRTTDTTDTTDTKIWKPGFKLVDDFKIDRFWCNANVVYYYHFVGHCGAFCGLKWRIWRAKMYFSPLK